VSNPLPLAGRFQARRRAFHSAAVWPQRSTGAFS
jgi:hypothetical protein